MEIIMQDGIKDCGICCLLSIIRFYGGEVSKEYLRELTHTTKEGVSFYHLIEAAKKIGFEAVGVSGDLESIDVNNLPCIVHFIVNKSYKHFVVLYQMNKKKQQVTIMDPSKGKKTISFSEFKLLTSSNYIFLKPYKKLPIIKKKKIIYQNMKELFLINKKNLCFIVLLTFSYFFINLLTSFHFKYILEYSINYQITNNIHVISYIMVSLYLVKNINYSLRNILLMKWTSLLDEKTTTITYKQLLLLPYIYYKNRTTGEVVSRFKDLNTIRSFLSSFFILLTTDLISVILFFWIMSQYSWKLSILILFPLLLLLFYTIIINPKKKKKLLSISEKQDRINSYLIEGISNVDTMKGSHLEKRMIDKFKINYKSFVDSIYEYTIFIEIYQFFKNNIQDFIQVNIYGFGSYLVIKDKLLLSSFIIYQSFFSYFSNSFYHLFQVLEDYNSYKVALDRVEEIFMINKDNFKNNFFYLSYQLEGDICIKSLNYKIGSKLLFKDLDLIIKKGEKVLLYGESGSGKSTLLKMLLRYIEVDYGLITIANIDINHYHLENIRSHITYVTNNELLFRDSVKNNIILNKECSEEEFERVCKVCNIDEIVKGNMIGYDTLIEENGFNFSNGERQRIILARSILRKSSIYIFDEALSGIDIDKEKKILINIFDYLKGKTIIIISHRFNNKELFDRVLKLENGRINEST